MSHGSMVRPLFQIDEFQLVIDLFPVEFPIPELLIQLDVVEAPCAREQLVPLTRKNAFHFLEQSRAIPLVLMIMSILHIMQKAYRDEPRSRLLPCRSSTLLLFSL